MSQQPDKQNSDAYPDCHAPPQSAADCKTPTSTLSKSDTKVQPTSQQISALDITEVFTAASSVLHTGQLVKDEFFTLFEAVGTLEVRTSRTGAIPSDLLKIMDSKMDSGHLEPGETLTNEYDVLRNLSPEEVIGIMDQILCHEVAWHMGHPLSQTLFTCLYIERLLWPDPKTLEQAQFSRGKESLSDNPWLHRVLRSYCIATIKACHFVHNMVTGESYYEEEDFTSQLYHRELLPKISTSEIQTLLDDGLSYNESAMIPRGVEKAIKKRLLFRRSILRAFEQDFGPLRARTKSSLSCIPFLKGIKDSSHLGKSVNESFSTKVQRSLASSVPPRPMVRIDFSEAISHFETLCNDAADVDQILEIETSDDLFTAIWVFMSRLPQPSVYIRSLVQSFLWGQGTQRVLGRTIPKQFLFSALAALVLPNSSMLDPGNDLIESSTSPRYQMRQLLSAFHDKIGEQYINIFRNACLNRSRTRRTLCHLVLDWDSLQADAEDLDETLRTFTKEQPAQYDPDQPTFSYPLSSWVYHNKLNHIRHIIQMGFELTVYAPDELAGMYWYLSSTCGTHVSHIDRISFFLHPDTQTQLSLSQNSKPASKSDRIYEQAFQRALKNLFRTYTYLKATEAFSRALHALHTLLLRHEAIKIPPRPYSSNKLRYELRMKPFLGVSVPEPVTFEAFQEESSLAGINDEEVLEEAMIRIADARKFWEEVLKAGWSADLAVAPGLNKPSKAMETEPRREVTTIEGEWSKGVKNVIRACIATSISLATLKKRMDKTGELRGINATLPVPGEKDCWHSWWTVPKLSEAE